MMKEENSAEKSAGTQETVDARCVDSARESADEIELSGIFEYLMSDNGHQVVNKLLSMLDDIKKATLEKTAEQRKLEMDFQHRSIRQGQWLTAIVFVVTVGLAAVLAWHSKLDATVAGWALRSAISSGKGVNQLIGFL